MRINNKPHTRKVSKPIQIPPRQPKQTPVYLPGKLKTIKGVTKENSQFSIDEYTIVYDQKSGLWKIK
jgi:hypothetical protein